MGDERANTASARRLTGKPPAERIEADIRARVARLAERGVVPHIAIVRVGENANDIAYERMALKMCAALGIDSAVHALPPDVSADDYVKLLDRLGQDDSVHCIMPFRPLPKHISPLCLRDNIATAKDCDSITPMSSASIYDRSVKAFLPCTAEAVVELLKYYEIPLRGANVVIIGRSMVVGRALALLLLDEDATVTVCHSKTKDLRDAATKADIVIAAMGRAKFVDGSFVKQGAVVIDVGINDDGAGGICGDVDTESVLAKGVSAYTPVPGGVGSVTTSLLVRNVVTACERLTGAEI